LQEIQSHRAIENSDNIREQEEFKKLQRLITDSRNDIATMRQRVNVFVKIQNDNSY
jgi:FAD synthase